MRYQQNPTRLQDLRIEYTPEGIPSVREGWLVDEPARPENFQNSVAEDVSSWISRRSAIPKVLSNTQMLAELLAYSRTAYIASPGPLESAVEEEFRKHTENWLGETGILSDPVQIFMHPSHLKIIGMGKEVLPLILREVERSSGHWFVALTAISPVNPVPAEEETDLQQLTNRWLEWGRAEGLI